jgi:hypothetical protein
VNVCGPTGILAKDRGQVLFISIFTAVKMVFLPPGFVTLLRGRERRLC